ncbi:MAG: 16S rRNA (cytidine(1402)-2'-O)-methyltransferase [Candidatus Eutrophobiaceae bacterium]
MSGTLYIVATPIGNLGDLSPRASRILSDVDLIAAEDTRHSGVLLKHFGVSTPLVSLYDHNEAARVPEILEYLRCGKDVALISDAGTPLISDPGYRLTDACHQEGIVVLPVPGASALIAALSVSGLPAERFVFEGFLPLKSSKRSVRLRQLVREERTLIFYEAPHRIRAFLEEASGILGAERPATVCRELTKLYEECRRSSLGQLAEDVCTGQLPCRGEFVVLIQGCPAEEMLVADGELLRILECLHERLSSAEVLELAMAITGRRRNEVYQAMQNMKNP